MKLRYVIGFFVFGPIAAAVLAPKYANGTERQETPPGAGEDRPASSQLITTSRPQMHTFTLRLPWIGTVESRASVEVTALTAGRVVEIAASDNARIEKGSLVARLEGIQVDAERKKLESAIESLKSRLELAEEVTNWLKKNSSEQLITNDQVVAAEDKQLQLEAALRSARLNRDVFEEQTRITAPASGVFTHRRVNPGQQIEAGQVVGDIIDTGHLRVVASLFPPRDIALPGREVTLRLDDGRSVAGTVRSELPSASDTGAVTAWLEGPQIDAKFRPGQTVGGRMVIAAERETLSVPASAIVYDEEERPWLFTEDNETYEPRRVELGRTQDGLVEVLSGLSPDQTVVIQGGYEIFYRRFSEQFKVPD